MAFLFTKLLSQLLYPLALSCGLLVVALIASRRPKLRRVATLSALCILMLAGNSWLSIRLARSLEWRYPPWTEVPTGDVIVVLGGTTRVSSLPVIEGAAEGRIAHAAELYRAGKAPHLLLTGGGPPWRESGTSEAQTIADVLGQMHIPSDALWLKTESRTTRENALFTQRMLAERGIDRIILVTSALHMPRAKAAFEKVGLRVDPAPADFIVTPRKWSLSQDRPWSARLLELFPDPGELSVTTAAIKEYVGYQVYRLRGWI